MGIGRVIKTSPWLYGLERTRKVKKLEGEAKADVAIVGAGIAGISTAYFLLTRTDKSVTLIDRVRVADGSTGFNAGTATPIFERSFEHYIDRFGTERAKNGMLAVHEAWELLEEVHGVAQGMDAPIHLNGYFGYRKPEHVAPVMAENILRASMDIPVREIFYAEEWKDTLPGPMAKTPGLTFAPLEQIAQHLRTQDTRLAACVSEHEALVNTATMCEHLVAHLLATFPSRFAVYEDSPVTNVTFEDRVMIEAKEGRVEAEWVVLATNAYEKFKLTNRAAKGLNERFHKNISSRLAYMVGVFLPKKAEPASLAYIFKPEDEKLGISFEYVTERPYVLDGQEGALFTVGGPDFAFNTELVDYEKALPVRQGVLSEIQYFLVHHYGLSLKDQICFQWHGLLGYTESNARLVGRDPENERLFYNLGCNGVGILLSLWGGQRIADIFLKKELQPTMFDADANFSATTGMPEVQLPNAEGGREGTGL